MAICKLSYYIEALCQKQQEYCDFVDVFEYDNIEGVKVKRLSHSKLLSQYKVEVEGKKLNINLLNSAWLTERKEKPGYLYFPSKEYKKITKDSHIEITVYHHPSNWMHPNDRNEFNRWVMNKSDLVYVGHEHLGRNESVETRDTVYHAQYGEVLQERGNPKNSGFILSYIEDNENTTNIFNWDDKQKMYTVSYTLSKKLDARIISIYIFKKIFKHIWKPQI